MATIPKKTLRWANEEGESLEEVKEFSKTNLVELPPPLTDTREAIDKEISKLPWTNSSDIEASLEVANNILNIIERADKINYNNKKIDGLITRLDKILDSIITLDKIKAYIPKYRNYNKNNGAALIAEYEATLQRRDIITKKAPIAEKKEAEKEVVATKPEVVAEKVEPQVAAEPEVVEKFQATNLPTLLNIAGEIINLSISTKSGNSGRMNLIDFYANFTKDENEVMILTKVFGIRSLRYTPSILTDEGCSLTDDEKNIVTKILEKRRKTLEEGLSLTRGILADTTRMKISRLKLLLKRIDGGFDSPLPCQPSDSIVTKSAPSISTPAWMKGQNKSTEELLISLFLLLIGISSEKIKAKNVQDTLSNESIDSLLGKLKSKSLTPANIDSTSSKILELLAKLVPDTPATGTAATGTAVPNTPAIGTAAPNTPATGTAAPTAEQAVARVTALIDRVKNPDDKGDAQNITQFGKMIQDYTTLDIELDKVMHDKAAKEAEKAGADDAKKFIKRFLDTQEAGLKDLQGRHNASVDNATKAGLKTSIDTKNSLIKIFREKISTIDADLIKLTSEIEKATQIIDTTKEKVQKLKDEGIASLKLMEDIAAKKEKSLETEIRQKDEQLTAQKKLLKELAEKKAPTKATEEERNKTKLERTQLQEQVNDLKKRNIEIETEFHKLISKPTPEVEVDVEVVEKESARLRIDALEAAHKKTKDTEIGLELVKLKGVKATKNNNPQPVTANSDAKLKPYLNEQNGGNRPNIKDIDSMLEKFLFQTALIEKDTERFCLLYYFITYFWKSIRDNLAEPAERDYLDRLDKLYFPDMKRNEFWPIIILIAKIIHKMRTVANEKPAVLSSDMIALLDQLNGTKGEQTQLLESIYQQVDIFLPQSPVFALKEDGSWKLQRAPSQECSIFQMGPLYLLLMKLTHRYIYNIIEESPNRLKCQSRLNPSL